VLAAYVLIMAGLVALAALFGFLDAAAPLVPVNPIAAAGTAVVVGCLTEQVAEGFYDAVISGRVQTLVMRLMLGVR